MSQNFVDGLVALNELGVVPVGTTRTLFSWNAWHCLQACHNIYKGIVFHRNSNNQQSVAVSAQIV